MLVGYITCKNKTEAKKIATALLSKNLAACVNSWPQDSAYCWQKKLVQTKEVALLFKTTKEKTAKIKKEITKTHSYEIPSLVFWEVTDVLSKYEKWVTKQLKSKH